MGRAPCRSKDATLNRGAWTAQEDMILTEYVRVHGHGEWNSLPKKAGLKRCGKSCRLRWLNYRRPDIKRGNISPNEQDLIIKLHRLLGNRWSLIAARLPGRTDNEVKNHWNSYLSKRVSHKKTPPKHRKSLKKSPHSVVGDRLFKPTPIRFTKRCTNNVGISNPQDMPSTDATNSNTVSNLETWSDLLVDDFMTGHDCGFVDFALSENMIDLESLSMEICGHSTSSQLNVGNLKTAEHSHSEALWCSSSGECDFVNDLQILEFDSSPGHEWERVLSSMESNIDQQVSGADQLQELKILEFDSSPGDDLERLLYSMESNIGQQVSGADKLQER